MHPRDIFMGGSPDQVTITGFGVAQALEDGRRASAGASPILGA